MLTTEAKTQVVCSANTYTAIERITTTGNDLMHTMMVCQQVK
ncbi:hypothetical protein [Vibrio kasasachensis]